VFATNIYFKGFWLLCSLLDSGHPLLSRNKNKKGWAGLGWAGLVWAGVSFCIGVRLSHGSMSVRFFFFYRGPFFSF